MAEIISISKRAVTQIDAHIGQQLKKYRALAGKTQAEVAEALGVSWQQVQKYESGADRLTASRVYSIAHFLGVSPIDFYADLPSVIKKTRADLAEGLRLLDSMEGSRLARAYASIKNDELRSKAVRIFEMISETQEGRRK